MRVTANGMTASVLLCALFAIPAQSAHLAVALTEIKAPTKGKMQGIVGDAWSLHVDVAAAERVGFLPDGEPFMPEREEELKNEVMASYKYLKDFARHRGAMLASGYYTSGKGFQKVGMICLLLERFFHVSDTRTQECTDWLSDGFKCYYDPTSENCNGASYSYYDGDWGGLSSRQGWDGKECNSDYGNTCYNDHHYHFGYFVVSAAILVKLRPTMLQDESFVGYVHTLIRDTSNPSSDDAYFPRFRTFDWFDLHSWSHGVQPMHDGKDQESTSEELNLLYGLHLWGRVTGNTALQKLGATMLSLAAHTVREFFLMKNGNPHHPDDFVRNHVTGIFMQNKVVYSTWFGGKPEYIHGIQMLPLSPALQLTRRPDFCQQEWQEILKNVDLKWTTKAWASLLLTGGLAMLDPEKAYTELRLIQERDFDNGLTRAWALYWTATKPGTGALALATASANEMAMQVAVAGASVLVPIGKTAMPSDVLLASGVGQSSSWSQNIPVPYWAPRNGFRPHQQPASTNFGRRCDRSCVGFHFPGGWKIGQNVCATELCADLFPFVDLNSFGCNGDPDFTAKCCDTRQCGTNNASPTITPASTSTSATAQLGSTLTAFVSASTSTSTTAKPDSTSTTSVLASTSTLTIAEPPPLSTPVPNVPRVPVSAPDEAMFPSRHGHPVPPAHTEVAGAKATNKFWANWVVGNGHLFPIFPMPYVLKWGGLMPFNPVLEVAHSDPHSLGQRADGRMLGYLSTPITEFTIGVKEAASGYFVVREGLFGMHAEIRGHAAGQVLRFPIYSGMAYISGRYSGGFTPKVSHPHGIARVDKVQDGIWSFTNRRGKEFRVYVFHAFGEYVDSSYTFDAWGNLNRAFDGWLRIAHVLAPSDTQVLDAHARAVVVDCELEVLNNGTVRYKFQKQGANDVEVLHWAYGHHVQLMQQDLDHSAGRRLSSEHIHKDGPLIV